MTASYAIYLSIFKTVSEYLRNIYLLVFLERNTIYKYVYMQVWHRNSYLQTISFIYSST